jgi:hypothetical protein
MGTSYQTHPKQKAAVGLAHSFSPHFLKLNLRTKYISYMGGLPPLSHSLRFKMLTHSDWFSSLEIFNIVRIPKMIQTVFDLGWPRKCALATC